MVEKSPSELKTSSPQLSPSIIKVAASVFEQWHFRARLSCPSPLLFLFYWLCGVSLSYHAGWYFKELYLRDNPILPARNESFHGTASMRSQTILLSSASSKQSAEIITEDIHFETKPFDGDNGAQTRSLTEQPTAISVLMDMEFVNEDFLVDKDAIRAAMLMLTQEASRNQYLTLKSIHCQININVNCVARFEAGHHLTVMTFPSRGMLIMNFYAPIDGDLVDMIALMQKHFAVGNPRVRWNHILRGQREKLSRWRTYENDIADIFFDFLKFIFYKTPIGRVTSKFQDIDIWDFVDARVSHVIGYEQSLIEGTYEHAHAELYKPNRVLFLDGVLQSTARGDEAYHEALVHPAMLVHPNPKRVAIIGGGEGATLREVLKHKTVDVCKMIEIDALMVQAAKEFLPQLNNCADFGTHESCFEDSRATILCEDAFAWFTDRFGESKSIEEEPFDLIIMDALDPEDKVEFAQGLYKDHSFWRGLNEALGDDGILVMQLGESPSIDECGEQFGDFSNRANLFDTIVEVGFSFLHLYEEAHCDFTEPWSYLIACKTAACSEQWFANEAEISLKIHQRIRPTKSGDLALKYFDGSTMRRYQRATRAWATVHCRAEPQPKECQILDRVNAFSILEQHRASEHERIAADLELAVETCTVKRHANNTACVFNKRPKMAGLSPVRDRFPSLFL